MIADLIARLIVRAHSWAQIRSRRAEDRQRTKWDMRFVSLAEHISTWSKDPSTQCGAVIVDRQNRIMGIGFNGFPRGVQDSLHRLSDRAIKYPIVLHAESNAIDFATKTQDCTIYVHPMPPCAGCMSKIIQNGITRVVAPRSHDDRWSDSVKLSLEIASDKDVNIQVDLL